MLTWKLLLILLVLLGVASWFVLSLSALELARRRCLEACQQAGLQFLDQSISQTRWQLNFVGGRLMLRRRYRFEVSREGWDRLRGEMSLLGGQVEWVRLPAGEADQQ